MNYKILFEFLEKGGKGEIKRHKEKAGKINAPKLK